MVEHMHLLKYSFEVCYYIFTYFTVLPYWCYFMFIFHYIYLQMGQKIWSIVQTQGTLTNFIQSGWSLLCCLGVGSVYQTVISLKLEPLNKLTFCPVATAAPTIAPIQSTWEGKWSLKSTLVEKSWDTVESFGESYQSGRWLCVILANCYFQG